MSDCVFDFCMISRIQSEEEVDINNLLGFVLMFAFGRGISWNFLIILIFLRQTGQVNQACGMCVYQLFSMYCNVLLFFYISLSCPINFFILSNELLKVKLKDGFSVSLHTAPIHYLSSLFCVHYALNVGSQLFLEQLVATTIE